MKDEVNGNKKGGFGDAPELKQYDSLQEAIRDLFGNERSVVSSRSVSGGDINEARTLRLDDGTVLFMKANQARSIGNFLAEARGIRAIAAAGAIGTPRILGAGVDGSRSFLLMEYITGRSRIAGYWAVFAHELARMHRTPTDPEIGFGFPRTTISARTRRSIRRMTAGSHFSAAAGWNRSFGLRPAALMPAAGNASPGCWITWTCT